MKCQPFVVICLKPTWTPRNPLLTESHKQVLPNNEDPDKIPKNVASHLGLTALFDRTKIFSRLEAEQLHNFKMSTCGPLKFISEHLKYFVLTLCTRETPKRKFLQNSEDPDEMPNNAAFHQGLHYLLR